MLLWLCVLLVFAVLPASQDTGAVHAAAMQSVTADDLLALVNGLRTGNGLKALTINSILMSTAQSTAQTMADGDLTWHIGSTSERIQAAGYGGGVRVWATENFAMSPGGMTIEEIQSVWADEWHMIPMRNPIYCDLGAGVAQADDGTIYYLVHAAYTDTRYCGTYIGPHGETIPTIQAQTQQAGGEPDEIPAGQDDWMAPVITVTPNANGELRHEVLYGHTLWSIAITYGTKMELIKQLNGMWYDDVYVGQKLLIPTPEYFALTPTITPTPTEVPGNPASVATTSAATATQTPTVTPGPNASMALQSGAIQDSNGIATGQMIFIVLGIAVLSVILSLWQPWKPRKPDTEPEDPLHTRVE